MYMQVLAAENVTLDVAVELLRLCGGGKPGRPSPKRIPEPVTSNKEKDRQLKKLVQAAIAENGRKKQADLAEEHLSSDALDHQGHETSPLPESNVVIARPMCCVYTFSGAQFELCLQIRLQTRYPGKAVQRKVRIPFRNARIQCRRLHLN